MLGILCRKFATLFRFRFMCCPLWLLLIMSKAVWNLWVLSLVVTWSLLWVNMGGDSCFILLLRLVGLVFGEVVTLSMLLGMVSVWNQTRVESVGFLRLWSCNVLLNRSVCLPLCVAATVWILCDIRWVLCQVKLARLSRKLLRVELQSSYQSVNYYWQYWELSCNNSFTL